MNGNEAQTGRPDAAVEKIERGTWLSRTSSRAKEWKAVERVDNSMTGAPTARPAGDD